MSKSPNSPSVIVKPASRWGGSRPGAGRKPRCGLCKQRIGQNDTRKLGKAKS
jgi:hypothetical protein